MSIAKKIIAGVTMVTVASFLAGPNVAQALTAAELQVQIDALMAQLATLQSQLSNLQGGTTGGAITGVPSDFTFETALKQGMSSDDVKYMQIVLNSDVETQLAASGVGSAGNETMYFGPLTKAAVVKFQDKYASEVLAFWGLTSGTGYVGSTTMDKLNSLLSSGTGGTGGTGGDGGDGTGTGGTTAGENKVGLAADSPAAASVAKGAQDVIFMKVNFCAASEANTVSKLIFSRGGIAADTDISAVKLYEGTSQVGSTQAVNSTTHKASFASLNWTIAANSCKVLTVKASIASAATVGNTPKLSIASASSITSTVALDGVFPIESKGKTVAGISVGALQVSTTTPSGSVVAGATEQGVAGLKFTASSSEGVTIQSIKLTEVGSSVDTDISNVKLFYGSTQLGATVASLVDGAATFDLSAAPLEILAGNSKDVTVYVDIGMATGINNRTIQFEVTNKENVTAYGDNSGGSVISYGAAWNTGSEAWPQKAASITINLGSITVAKDTSYSPSAQDYARGSEQNKIMSFKFTAGANEGIRITKLKIKSATGTALADADVSNITLYDAETGAQLTDTAGNAIPPASMVSGYVTFGSNSTGLDTTGLFDVPKSTSKNVMVKADIPAAAATGTGFLGFEINNPTVDVWADGLSSQNDIASSLINANVTTKVPSTSVMHQILQYGTLTVGASADTPAASTYAVGTSEFTFAKFDLTTTGEEMSVTQFNVLFATTSATATTSPAGSGDVNNIKLYDGTTLLQTDSQVSSGYAEFSISLVVPKNDTKTLTVKGDIPTGSSNGGLQAWIQKKGDLTVSGKSSGVTINTTASDWTAVKGNYMTKALPIVTVAAAPTPASKTVIKNTASALVGTIYFTATPTEAINITRIQIAAGATSTATSTAGTGTTTFRTLVDGNTQLGGLDVKDYVGNVRIYDGSTQLGSTVPTMTLGSQYSYADFTGLSLVVPKGQTKAIDIKADITRSTTTAGNSGVCFYFGVATTTAASVDVSGAGEQSGTAATIVIGKGGESGNCMLFGASGALTVQVDANSPVQATMIEGTTGQTFGKWKFTATNEAIKITKLIFDTTHSSSATGTSKSSTNFETNLWQLATSGFAETQKYAFTYSINDGATSTCFFPWTNGAVNSATSSDAFISTMNSASSSCWASSSTGIAANTATSSGAVTLYASPAGNYSLEITDYPYAVDAASTNASNTADNFELGIKYGGTETLGAYAGSDSSVVKVILDDGSKTWSSFLVNGSTTFNFNTGDEPQIAANNSKVLSLKVDLSDYNSAIEGSTMQFGLGSAATDYVTNYVVAKGVSSGSELASGSIVNSSAATSGALSANAMYLYATKPTVSLNASSPSGDQTVGTAKEVFRFDVTAPATGFDVNINAIRFTISTNASTSAWDKAYNLYKTTDLTTSLGKAVSWASATSTGTSGFVTIYPHSGNIIGSGGTVTYVLYANTSAMDESSTKKENLSISIASNDFYWDEGVAVNANQKTLNLPVTGNTLTY